MTTPTEEKLYLEANRSDEESDGTRVPEQINDQQPPSQEIGPAPDGGAEAWLVVLGGFLAMFCSFGWVNCMGVFQDYYQTHQLKEYPSSTISWISSLESCLMFITGPFCGTIFDLYGTRVLILVGSLMHVFGLMMASISHEYYQFLLAQGVCSALGAGFLFWPTMNCVQTWFARRRALAIGIAVSGSGLGGVCFPIAVERMIAEIGFAWAMRTCAFIILALCVVINLTVKSRIPPLKRKFSLLSYITPLKELPFFLTTFGVFLFGFGLFIPFNYIILFGKRWGMSQNLAKYLSSILNSASIFGRIIPGALADKLGRYNVMIVVCFLCSIWTLALWIPANTNALVILYAVLYGFCSGAFVSLPPALIGQISEIRDIGTRTGTLFFFTAIGALTGNPIGGALVDDPLHSSYWKLQVFAGVMMAAGGVSILLARISKAGPNIMKVF